MRFNCYSFKQVFQKPQVSWSKLPLKLEESKFQNFQIVEFWNLIWTRLVLPE